MTNLLSHDIIDTDRIRIVPIFGLSFEGDMFPFTRVACIEPYAHNLRVQTVCGLS